MKRIGPRFYLGLLVIAPTVTVLFKLAWFGNEQAIIPLVGMAGAAIVYFFKKGE